MTSRIIRIIVGIVLALLGIFWILQGADLLGGNGGMNGKGIWIVIGAVVLIAGVAVLAPLRRRQHE
jgi:drug/metabolite transporter (DMT)-like permease